MNNKYLVIFLLLTSTIMLITVVYQATIINKLLNEEKETNSTAINNTHETLTHNEYEFEFDDPFYSRITEDNSDEIVKGYVGSINNVLTYSIINIEGSAPYFAVIFSSEDGVNFHTVKRDENRWITIWSKILSSSEFDYLAVSNWNLSSEIHSYRYTNDDRRKRRQFVTLSGCMRSSCDTDKSIFIYDTYLDEGYLTIITDNPDIEIYFPFGIPENIITLEFLENKLIELSKDRNNNIRIEQLTSVVSLLPLTRRVPTISTRQLGSSEHRNVSIVNFGNINNNELSLLRVDFKPIDRYVNIYLENITNGITTNFVSSIDIPRYDWGFTTKSLIYGNDHYVIISMINGGASFVWFSPWTFIKRGDNFYLIEDEEKTEYLLNLFRNKI